MAETTTISTPPRTAEGRNPGAWDASEFTGGILADKGG
jgi:hypothetical protein